MGMVAMHLRQVGYDRGYPVSEATLYVYCDNCGSFNIGLRISPTKWFIIALVLTAAALLIMRDSQSLLCFIPLGLIGLFIPWRDILLSFRCRKCGNSQVTRYNALHYEAYNTDLVDVPDQWTQKVYIDSDFPAFWEYT
jgi:hypothetical protein